MMINKISASLIIIVLSFCVVNSQQTILIEEGPCYGYSLQIDEVDLKELEECKFDATEVTTDGQMTMIAKFNDSSFTITARDMLAIVDVFFDSFSDNQSIYQADYDQDGVVSTYDIASMNAYILGFEPFIENPHHIINAIEDIPMLDPFDIDVDYSQMTFTQDDFINGELPIKIIVVGNLE